MNLKALAVAAAVILGALPAARAQLKWENTEIELHPKVGDKEAVAHFKYQNTGTTTVNFKNVRSSCGCTVASLKKNDVAPGEKGEITATFNVGGRTGVQQKAVSVESDDPAQPNLNLQMKIVIPSEMEVQPAYVYWQAGEDPKPKTMSVKAGEGVTITKLDVTSSTPEFVSSVKKGAKAGEFTVSITPKATDHAVAGTITIKPDYPKTFYASAKVMPAASENASPADAH